MPRAVTYYNKHGSLYKLRRQLHNSTISQQNKLRLVVCQLDLEKLHKDKRCTRQCQVEVQEQVREQVLQNHQQQQQQQQQSTARRQQHQQCKQQGNMH